MGLVSAELNSLDQLGKGFLRKFPCTDRIKRKIEYWLHMLQVAEQSMQADPGDAEGVSAMFQDMFEKYVEDYVENNGNKSKGKGKKKKKKKNRKR